MPRTSFIPTPRSRFARRFRARLRLRPMEDRAVPAAFTVNSLSDAGVGTGTTGDLRYCITQANDEVNFPGLDTITFAVNGTITLGGTELFISAPLTINGPGADKLTVSGNNLSRVFAADDGGVTSIAVTFTGMTITEGLAAGTVTPAGSGGGIFVQDETLTIEDCFITNNNAGRRGGGVYSFGYSPMTIRNCTISGNKANGGDGGGVYNYGYVPMLIENCTITGNQAGGANGAGRGGGICFNLFYSTASLTIRNSTIVSNVSTSTTSTGGGGGIRTSAGTTASTVQIISSVVSGNTNAVAPDIRAAKADFVTSALQSKIGIGTPTFDATSNALLGTPFANLNLGPLAANGGTMPTRLPGAGSPLRNAGSNPAGLTTDQRGPGFPRTLEGQTDIGAVESIDLSPQRSLNPIGPITTPGATPNSVSITYSDNQSTIDVSTIDVNDITILLPDGVTKLPITAAAVDINTNGTPRVATYSFAPPGGAWDSSDAGVYTVVMNANQVFDTDAPPNAAVAGTIGTFAVTIPSTIVVNATNDEAVDTDGKTSLREALIRANKALGAPDTITFDKTIFGATQQKITLTLGQLEITDGVTILGPAPKVAIDGNAAGRVMRIAVAGSSSNPVNLTNLVIQNGKITGSGNADPTKRGGGVFIEDEAVTFTNCVITNNSSEGTGGGIYLFGATFPADPGSVTLIDSQVTNNKSDSTLTSFRNGSGGGISIDLAGKLVMQRTTVSGNTATGAGAGGGVYFVVSGSADIANSAIVNNTANGTTGGGGFYFYGTVVAGLKIANTTISGNNAPAGSGGGIGLNTFNGASKLELYNSTVANNTAGLAGGGVARVGGTAVDPFLFSSTIIAKNTSVLVNGNDLFADTPAVVPGDNNFIGDGDGSNSVFTGTGNIIGTLLAPEDPLLGPLDFNNGGPTPLHRLLAGSKALNAGNNVLGLATDQRGGGFVRVFGSAADIGAYEDQPIAAPAVANVVVNGGGIQRSMVTSMVINFTQSVTFPSGVNAAFQLTRTGPSGPTGVVNTNAVVLDSDTVVLTFANGGAVSIDPGGSLSDGTYTLKVIAANVLGANGNLNGGTDFTTPSVGPDRLFRLFGDSDGDGDVDAQDFGAFRGAFGASNPTFDYDGDGDVDAADFGQFRARFGQSV
jgi:hypothetical protein